MKLPKGECCSKCGHPTVAKGEGFEEMSREECIFIMCNRMARLMDVWGFDADAQVVTMACRFLIADEKRISALARRVEALEAKSR